jgi:hypothetical protein
MQLVGPGAVMAGGRALAKGNIQGQTIGDAAQMPGLMLVQDNCIVWQHQFHHVGDHPDWEQIGRMI